MKKTFLLMFVSIFSATLFAQDAKKAEDVVKFKTLTYNFGKIKQGVPVTHEFLFTNASERPVVIETAQASCGCTTPVWPQAPVGKGKTDKITAGFNAAAPGPFNKTITVKVAGVDAPLILTITGEVLSTEEYVKYEKSKNSKS
jgi:hypothetical protein